MIKQLTPTVMYVCDNCVKDIPGAAIIVYYPYGHVCDSVDGPSHFCSDFCMTEFAQKTIKKFRNWKSTSIKQEEKVKASEEDLKPYRTKPEPKSRKAPRSRKSQKWSPSEDKDDDN